jgi:ankyrin repeat protein
MQPFETTARRLTPLHLAAAANWPEAVSLLLAAGADKYAQDSLCCLPIDLALQSGCLEAVELLLEGDCMPQFTTSSGYQSTTMRERMLNCIISCDERLRHALLRTLIRLRPHLGVLQPYSGLIFRGCNSEATLVTISEELFLGGYVDLEIPDWRGQTPLMSACLHGLLKLANFFVQHGASISTPHRDSTLVAGHYLAAAYDPPPLKSNEKLAAKILEAAFNASNTVHSHCRCSPDGCTPVTALRLQHYTKIREIFKLVMSCLRWPMEAVEQQARAFAIGEVFDRLGMKHTCVNINNPSKQIAEEERLEIEWEEEELNDLLQQLMEEYDLRRAKFSGSPLEFLDHFFESHELDLYLDGYWRPTSWEKDISNWDGPDLLGPGDGYHKFRESFTGNIIYYGHREQVTEENMLALLFDEKANV